jgi:hypothetical protein
MRVRYRTDFGHMRVSAWCRQQVSLGRYFTRGKTNDAYTTQKTQYIAILRARECPISVLEKRRTSKASQRAMVEHCLAIIHIACVEM